jgi:hypothetical protein
MMKKYLLGALSVSIMVALAAPVHAQSTSNGTGTANVNTNSNQSSEASNSGVSAQVYQFGATKMAESVNAQVPLSLGGYGSFSQNNCENSVGLGATTKIVSIVYNAPKPEINCQQIVLSNAWGSESQLAHNEGKPIQAEMARATSVWQLCQINDAQLTMCIRKGWIVYDDPDHPDIHKTLPNPQFDENVNSRVVTKPTAMAPTATKPAKDVAGASQSLADAQASAGQQSLGNTSVGSQRWYQESLRNN